ncbi:helix-turn-helix domain-containing protein [uncultured Acetobacteroides sp.]|uniref:AraC family transcriptional regulator n=1 Tax=uncultured Acetobacteroides sp. TaxID=1760811 RepID=UPI0029F489E0|nr:helix-turn-helix domain-containing protein [uncultured Acetobacteroides sp.]
MNYQTATPSYPLSLFVKQYWAIESCVAGGAEHIQRIVPNGLMELMFYLGAHPSVIDSSRHLQDTSILSGQQNGFYDLAISEPLSMFTISFHPHGASMFFDIRANELFDQSIPLKLLVKDAVAELECRLYEACTFEGRVGIAERFLLNQLRKSSKEYEVNRMAHCLALVNRQRGMVAIDELASEACLSRKQLERSFLSYIGASPKQFLRAVRFQSTLFEKQQHADLSLTELAYRCGYYDQSHMISDYKKLSGKTPSQYFSECEPYSDYFL